MSKIHTLKINNFQWIENFEQKFNSDFICIIWRWDSWKTTILKAISYILYPNWNLSFYDTDFFNCNIEENIEIEATLFDIPEKLLQESMYGLYIRWINNSSWEIQDEINDEVTKCLTIKLIVTKDLEPKWYIVSNRQDDKEIRAWDRALFNAFFITDYIDRHFSWNKWTPLYSLLKDEWEWTESNGVILESIRAAKSQIDSEEYNWFDSVLTKVKTSASELWLNASNLLTTIDFKDISITEWKVSLHDNNIPFRQKWKWTKRLLSMAIQHELVKRWWIILIDEIEQWLEPDRVQHLVSTLKKNNEWQIFITTHSNSVLVELEYSDLFLKRENNSSLNTFNSDLQSLIRTRPESFFSKKIIVCEWETEFWICRAFNDYNIELWKENISSLWIKLVIWKWHSLIEMSKCFVNLGYKVALFCDSDDVSVNSEKPWLIWKGIEIIDWKNNNALESALFNNINYSIANELLELAINIKSDEDWEDFEKVKVDIYWNLKEKLWSDFPVVLDESNYNQDIKNVLWSIAEWKKTSWFKQIWKWIKLWNVIFSNYDDIESESEIKKNFDKLSNWIEND